MESQQEGASLVAKKRAEIDTRAPFQSVKEAVRLFAEKVLVDEVYATKLKKIHIGKNHVEQDSDSVSNLGALAAELEKTKLSLQKANKETMLMARCLSSLQEELQKTKRELKQLKKIEAQRRLVLSKIDEDVKFIDDSAQCEVNKQMTNNNEYVDNGVDLKNKKKRLVTFANPVSEAQITVPPSVRAALERHPSLRKSKKKPLIPLIGGIFSKKKSNHEVHFP